MSWQPIKTAPKDGTEVLLWCRCAWRDATGFVDKGSFRMDANASPGDSAEWLKDDYDDYSCGMASTPLNPTHWMPLPEPPEAT